MKPSFYFKLLPMLICAVWLPVYASATPSRFSASGATSNQTFNANNNSKPGKDLPKRQWKPFQKQRDKATAESNSVLSPGPVSSARPSFLQRRVVRVLAQLGQTGAFLAIMTPILLAMFGPFVYLFQTWIKGLIAVHGT